MAAQRGDDRRAVRDLIVPGFSAVISVRIDRLESRWLSTLYGYTHNVCATVIETIAPRIEATGWGWSAPDTP